MYSGRGNGRGIRQILEYIPKSTRTYRTRATIYNVIKRRPFDADILRYLHGNFKNSSEHGFHRRTPACFSVYDRVSFLCMNDMICHEMVQIFLFLDALSQTDMNKRKEALVNA